MMKLQTRSKAKRFLFLLGLIKIPMIFYCRPKVVEITDEKCVIKIPFKRRVRNHVNSMYIGALTIGADLTSGFLAMRHIETSGKNIVLIFKNMHADYLKLVQGDAYFTCSDGEKVKAAVQLAAESGERQNTQVDILVTVPGLLEDEPAAKYTLTLSIKDKG